MWTTLSQLWKKNTGRQAAAVTLKARVTHNVHDALQSYSTHSQWWKVTKYIYSSPVLKFIYEVTVLRSGLFILASLFYEINTSWYFLTRLLSSDRFSYFSDFTSKTRFKLLKLNMLVHIKPVCLVASFKNQLVAWSFIQAAELWLISLSLNRRITGDFTPFYCSKWSEYFVHHCEYCVF